MSEPPDARGTDRAPSADGEASACPDDPGAQLEGLLDAVHQCVSPEAWTQVEALVSALLSWHGAGLRRILDLLSEDDGQPTNALERIARDDGAAALLLLHDLHPVGTRQRVEAALEEARPVLRAHRGDIELVGIEDGLVRVRLLGSCNGCSSSLTTLQETIVRAVEQAAPELAGVEVVDAPKPATAAVQLVSLDPTRRGPGRGSKSESAHLRCELCADPLPPEHAHVVDLDARSLRCACRACAILFRAESTQTGRHRTVPDRILHDARSSISGELLTALGIPVRLAFVFWNASLERAIACYPSPAGAVEAELAPEQWNRLVAASPLARMLEPDVEAILVHGERGQPTACVLVPIDVCYRLVATVREHWEGMQGGDRVWAELASALADVHRRSRPATVSEGGTP